MGRGAEMNIPVAVPQVARLLLEDTVGHAVIIVRTVYLFPFLPGYPHHPPYVPKHSIHMAL
jgi:hypothetical protein